MHIGAIRELWRYPVKSMGGERLDHAEVEKRGFVGDRLWAVREEATGTITGAKKYPVLLQCAARFVRSPQAGGSVADIPPVVLGLPDGTEIASDDARVHVKLSEFVGKSVTLCALRDAGDFKHYRAKVTQADLRRTFAVPPDEPLPDLSMLPLWKLAQLAVFATPPGTYFDAYPLHVLTTTTLETLRTKAPDSDFDVRRFRPNVLVEANQKEGLPEFEWCGGTLRAGEVTIEVEAPTVRCSMPTRTQGALRADPHVLKTVSTHAERCCGVYASIGHSGLLRVGDPLELERAEQRAMSAWADAGATRLKRFLLRATAAVLPK